MTGKSIYNVVNGLKYVCDESIDKTLYDGKGTVKMTKSDWVKFKKEIGKE